MTIAFGTSGTVATGSTSLAVPHPASIAAGDLLVLVVCNKYPTNSPATPAGWTAPTNFQQSGGSGSAGIDVGTVYCTVFVKIALGSESGNLTVTITSGNSAVGRMFRYTKASAKNWEWSLTNGSDNTAGTTWSVTGAANPGITGGDVVVMGSAINTDGYTYSAQALAATGVTFGTATERQDSGTTTGQDCGLMVSDHLVTSGTASAAPVYTATSSGTATNNPAGASVFLRIREVDKFIDPGGIAGAEAFGTAVEQQFVEATGIAGIEAFGTAIEQQFMDASGIAGAEAFGTLVEQQFMVASGIGTAEALGDPTLEIITAIYPVAIAGEEAFGTAIEQQFMDVSGTVSGEAFGTLTTDQPLIASSIGTAEAFGSPSLDEIVGMSGVVSGEAFGASSLSFDLTAAGIGSGEAFGTAVEQEWLDASGIGTAEVFGIPDLGTAMLLDPSAIGTAEGFGSPNLAFDVAPGGIGSSEAFGDLSFQQFLQLPGIGTAEAFGGVNVGAFLDASGIGTEEAFGPAVILVQIPIDVFGITSAEAFGSGQVVVALLFKLGREQTRAISNEPVAFAYSTNQSAYIRNKDPLARALEGPANLSSAVVTKRDRLRVTPNMFTIKKGDTAPSYSATLQTKTDGQYVPIDLTGATVQFIMGAVGQVPIVEAAAILVDAVAGKVRYDWGVGDTDTAGDYSAVFVVTFPDNTVQTCPTNEFLQVRIVQNLG